MDLSKPLYKARSDSNGWIFAMIFIIAFGASILMLHERFFTLKLVLGIFSIFFSILAYGDIRKVVIWEDRIEFKYMFNKKTYQWHELEGWFPIELVAGKLPGAKQKSRFPGMRLVKKEKKGKSPNFNTLILDESQYMTFGKIKEIVSQKLPEVDKPDWAIELEK